MANSIPKLIPEPIEESINILLRVFALPYINLLIIVCRLDNLNTRKLEDMMIDWFLLRYTKKLEQTMWK